MAAIQKKFKKPLKAITTAEICDGTTSDIKERHKGNLCAKFNSFNPKCTIHVGHVVAQWFVRQT